MPNSRKRDFFEVGSPGTTAFGGLGGPCTAVLWCRPRIKVFWEDVSVGLLSHLLLRPVCFFEKLKHDSSIHNAPPPMQVRDLRLFLQDTKLEVLQAFTDARREVGILARPIPKFVRLISY